MLLKLLLSNETYIIKDVQSFDVQTNTGMQFKYNPKINLETKPEGFEISKSKSIVSEELTDLPESARNFNDAASAVTKIGAGATAAGSAIYANSLRDDSEVKQVAGKSVDEAIDYSSQFIG
jgi:hypothetical protein